MPPQLALVLFLLFVCGAWWIESRAQGPSSWSRWLAAVWFMILAARQPAKWFSSTSVNLEEGNPFERTIYSVLIAAAVIILIRRRFEVSRFATANVALLCLLAYAALSVLWSDYPFVAFKRYIKFFGIVAMALVVLTDSDRVAALKSLIRRSSYLLIPASVLLIKYYRHLGVRYEAWGGAPMYQGIADNKNSLGQLCLVLAVGLLWVLVTDWSSVQSRLLKARRAVDIFVAWLAIDTLLMSNSATSLVCVGVGALVFASTRVQLVQRRFGALLATGIVIAVLVRMVPGVWEGFTALLGRDPTLTNRTDIWSELWVERGNLLVGTGFDSFWLGERLTRIRDIRHINEAHNGYYEVFLQLGIVGLVLQLCVLASAYRNSRRLLHEGRPEGRLFIAYFVVVLLYNLAESGFRGMGPINFVFLLIAAKAATESYALAAVPARLSPAGRASRVLAPTRAPTPLAKPVPVRTVRNKWIKPRGSWRPVT
jgi:exopolysaccharide production protein ExoQ